MEKKEQPTRIKVEQDLFIPPKVFCFGNIPKLNQDLFTLKNLSTLFQLPKKPEEQTKKIQLFYENEEKMGINLPVNIKKMLNPKLEEKDFFIPRAFSSLIHICFYFHDATERFLPYDARLIKKLIFECELFVYIVITDINNISERQNEALKKNIKEQLDEEKDNFKIFVVSDSMKGTIICPYCEKSCKRNIKQWMCETKDCKGNIARLCESSFGYDSLYDETIQKFNHMFLHRWKVPKNKFNHFTAKENCHITLYQDAYTAKEWTYKEDLNDTVVHNAYEDMYDAILNAKEFVYIFAWSMKHDLHPCPSKERPLSVEQLLKKKAEEIQVCVALWNKDSSLMPTSNSSTEKSFKGSKVNIKMIDNPSPLVPLSHHLKMLMCDEPNGNVIAFLGGLDLAEGRLDTPEHTLYDEFGNKKVPWHDIHGKIEGETAIDVVKSFADRWESVKPDIPLVFNGSKSMIHRKKGNWVSQVFRSDTICGYVEKGLQCAFINAIRNAERFIYIENQYFCGGSSEWKLEYSGIIGGELLAPNIVPMEILNKIYQMILLKRDFKVYVVLPYRPWGDSDGTVRFGLPNKTLKLHITTMQTIKLHITTCIINYQNFSKNKD